MALQHLRSSTAHKRPTPAAMSDGQLAINTNADSPGLFFKDSTGALTKVGPVHVGTTAPNASPASGGETGNTVGEQWLDTTGGTYVFKVWDGSAWRSETGTFVDVNGDTMTGALGIIAGDAATPGLFVSGDTNTGIYSPGADQLAISTNGTQRVNFGTGEVVFNDGGENYDFRIEGDTNSSLFFVDASTDRVGIGVTGPQYPLHTETTGTGTAAGDNTAILVQSQGDGRDCNIRFGDNFNSSARIGYLSNNLYFYVNANERARIDSAGRLLVGTSSATSNNILVVQGYPGDPLEYGAISVQRGVAPGSSDTIGLVNFNGEDNRRAAAISCVRDGGTWTSGSSHPGRLVFSTTADGASSPTERMRIDKQGFSKHSNNGAYTSTAGSYHEFNSTINSQCFIAASSNASYSSRVVDINVHRSANAAYSFLRGQSGNFSDTEFNLRGDGNAYADGSWNGGGADYAEYFEWSDGNTTAEDRRGTSVVLDGDKIREAVAGEEPIGVISGNPSVVGDAAWNKWNGKYLRDDFGTYIQEDYEVEDEDGNTVTQQRRKLNPDYDPDVEYISREDRPEWDCVGLMGKLRIRKGQVTGARWIKMRDISDSVEEWLVR